MSMTKKRKSLQDKLRRKFGWHTNTNYNRGTILEKLGVASHTYHDPKYVIDLHVDFDDWQIRREVLNHEEHGVGITLYKYSINKDGSFLRAERLTSRITLKELELIYKIAKEKEFEICRDE